MKHLLTLIILISVFIAGFFFGRGGFGDFLNTCPSFRQASIPLVSNIDNNEQLLSEEVAEVQKVIDGDTIILADGRKVRYIGIDAPETGRGLNGKKECYADEATKQNKALVFGKKVRLLSDQSDRDKYNRLLRYVYVEDVLINEKLVEYGAAIAKRYEPNVRYQGKLQNAQKQAKEQKNGLWSKCVDDYKNK